VMRFRLPAVLVLLIPSLCHAAGGAGHPIVALIAGEQRLPAAKVGTEVAANALLVNASNAAVANGAADVRRERRERGEMARWHEVNISVTAVGRSTVGAAVIVVLGIVTAVVLLRATRWWRR